MLWNFNVIYETKNKEKRGWGRPIFTNLSINKTFKISIYGWKSKIPHFVNPFIQPTVFWRKRNSLGILIPTYLPSRAQALICSFLDWNESRITDYSFHQVFRLPVFVQFRFSRFSKNQFGLIYYQTSEELSLKICR